MFTPNRDQELVVLVWLMHFAGLLSLAAGGVVLHYWVFRPLAEREANCRAQAEIFERLLEKAAQIRQEHAELNQALASIEQRAEAVRRRIPDQPREAEFLSELAQIAGDERVRIHDYRRGAVTRKETHSQLTVQLSIEANYHSLCVFLDRLAKLPRVATVERMEVAAPSDRAVYPVDMTLVLYFGLQPASPKRTS